MRIDENFLNLKKSIRYRPKKYTTKNRSPFMVCLEPAHVEEFGWRIALTIGILRVHERIAKYQMLYHDGWFRITFIFKGIPPINRDRLFDIKKLYERKLLYIFNDYKGPKSLDLTWFKFSPLLK